jgi:bifunctional DNA-binding transcriptional regulator/antitoxin component of YhaV-PrlF toxin-antitoxin module
MMLDRAAMERITKHLPTKSEKIRRLSAAGYPRSEIAKFLDIRYQHVRNVLVDDERKRSSGFSEAPSSESPPRPTSTGASPHPGRISLREDGSIVLPPSVLAAVGFKTGDAVVIRAEGDGEIHLLSSKAAVRRAQKLVREFVRDDVSLVDELLKERRREAENE